MLTCGSVPSREHQMIHNVQPAFSYNFGTLGMLFTVRGDAWKTLWAWSRVKVSQLESRSTDALI